MRKILALILVVCMLCPLLASCAGGDDNPSTSDGQTDTESEATEIQGTETEPEGTEPETTDPEATDPEVTEPEATEPEGTEPEATEPETTEPGVTEPEVTEPEVTEPEVTEPEVTEPEATEPKVTEPEVTEPETTEPEEELSKLEFTLINDGTAYEVSGIGEETGNDIVIPATYKGLPVIGIGSDAFRGCRGLISITIPSSVTSIGYSAFRDCRSLTSITIPSSVTSIGSYAFSECDRIIQIENGISYVDKWVIDCDTSVTNVSLRSDTVGIGSSAFYKCSSLESITIPSSVTGIASSAFAYCSSLKTVAFGEESKLESIGYDAFDNCTSLESITIPSSVTSIGEDAFWGCSSLNAVCISDLAAWCQNSFSELISNPYNLYLDGELVTELVIPEGVTSIGFSAFSGCTALTEINFNATAMNDLSGSDHVFSNAGQSGNGITVNIGVNVTKIPAYLFYGSSYAPKIISVVFAENSQCESIGSYAFSGCSSLTIYVEAASKPSGWDSDWNYSNCTVVWDCKNQ